MVDTALDLNAKTKRLAFPSLPFRELKFIVFGLLIWVIAAQIMVAIYPDTESGNSAVGKYLRYAARNGGLFMVICSIVGIFKLMSQTGDMSLLEYLKTNAAKLRAGLGKILINFVLGIVTFAVFLMAYSTIKTRIPEIAPYSWDKAFFELDRLLFFGRDPWTLFAWIYDYPAAVKFIDFTYDIWAVILVGVWTLCFVSSKHTPAIRLRFPLAVMLTWFVGGNILAILLSSAGPCYYGAITGLADPYALQMAKLAAIDPQSPLRAVEYQGILWQVYESPSVGLGGISAMPSMHCATSFLLIMLAWKHKALRYAAIAFFIFILISSFVLAWHYAVDGLLAIPVAWSAWWLAGKITFNQPFPKP